MIQKWISFYLKLNFNTLYWLFISFLFGAPGFSILILAIKVWFSLEEKKIAFLQANHKSEDKTKRRFKEDLKWKTFTED